MNTQQYVQLTYDPSTGQVVRTVLRETDVYGEWHDVRELYIMQNGTVILSRESQESEVIHAPSQGEKPQNDQ